MSEPPEAGRRPRLGRRLVVALVVAAGTLAVLGLAGAGYLLTRAGSAPTAVSLQDTTPTASADSSPAPGTWLVDDGFVGYRVSEPPDITVAGRTEDVVGDLTLEGDGSGLRLVDATVEADLGALRSDAAGRDRALRGRLLETDRYPRASFTLTEPVELGTIEAGRVEDVTARGELTVRERTAPVTADLAVRWDGPTVRLVGTLDVSLADYAVDVPSVAGVDTIRDAAVVELDLQARPAPTT